MGSKITVKISVLAVLLLGIFFNTYFTVPIEGRVSKSTSLIEYLGNIPGYQLERTIPLIEEHFQMLKLDDYLFADYQGNGGKVNLYIGFYYTADKVTAAHSPLVCFPGQGWSITSSGEQRLTTAEQAIRAAEITASLQDEKLYVLYWFQAHHTTSPRVYINKLHALYNQFFTGQEQTGFVRVSIPMGMQSEAVAREKAQAFISAFYPQFQAYLEQPAVLVSQ